MIPLFDFSGRSAPRKWLLSLLVLALPFALAACEPREQPVDDPIVFDDDEAPITSIGMLTGVTDADQLEGREVQLINVEIVEVLGDSAFYVAQGTPQAGAPGQPGAADQPGAPGQPGVDAQPATPGQQPGTQDRVLVIREDMGWGDATATTADYRVGQRVDIYGEVRSMADRRNGTWGADRQDDGFGVDQPGETQPGATQPGVGQDTRVGADHTLGETIYVAAHRIETSGAGAATVPGAAPGQPGAPDAADTGDADAPDGAAY